MTGLPLPPPPPIPDDHDARLPDELTRWQRLHRRVLAIMAQTPALRLAAGTGAADIRTAIRRVNAVGTRPILPRTIPVVMGDGYERAEPDGVTWCEAVGLERDDGAGARLVQSEVGDLITRGYVQYGIAVALATLNEAAHRYIGLDRVFRLVTSDSRERHRGYFGRQGGRWAASLQNPTQRALAAFRVAKELRVDEADFTRGARRWIDAYTQDRLFRSGRVKYDAVGILDKWAAEGWTWIGPVFEADGQTPLIDPYRLLMFKSARGDTWQGSQAIKDGRQRWGVAH